MKLNPATLIDGYKLDHRRQYPPHTRRVYSNWTARSSRLDGVDKVRFFGLQGAISEYQEWMDEHFFSEPREKVLGRYARRVNGYLGPNDVGTNHIGELHELGYLPLRFAAIPEGKFVPLRVPMFVVENTSPEFFWMPNYLETMLSCMIWPMSTSATIASRYRVLLDQYAAQTGGDLGFVDWQGHDFSFRGLEGPEAAARIGAGHLLSFTGTDTIPAIDYLEDYYGDGLPENYLLGGSVAATEHAVMCAGGKEGELNTIRRLLQLYPTGVLSVVSDTWDLWKVLTETLPQLKGEIMARNGKYVTRPDSGDPVKIICGDPDKHGPPGMGVTQLLWDTFGGTLTPKGYRLLDPHVGGIYGDSITYERAGQICEGLEKRGFASTNWVLGIGSFTYQYNTRDTFGHAMKATWAETEGEERDLFKKPVTDDGTKFSATGRLAVVEEEGRLVVVEKATPEIEFGPRNLMQPVWENGKFLRRFNVAQVRQNF